MTVLRPGVTKWKDCNRTLVPTGQRPTQILALPKGKHQDQGNGLQSAKILVGVASGTGSPASAHTAHFVVFSWSKEEVQMCGLRLHHMAAQLRPVRASPLLSALDNCSEGVKRQHSGA